MTTPVTRTCTALTYRTGGRCDLAVPDLTIYLHTNPAELTRRIRAKGDQTRSDQDLLTDPGLLQRLQDRYDQIAAADPTARHLQTTGRSPDELARIVTDIMAGEKVLLLRRANTGFADGSWSVPGGCLDDGENLPMAAAREAREEVGITIGLADLAFAHLCHHADPDGQARVGVFFAAQRWAGEPVNAEPGKCSEIGWHHLDSLPTDIVSYIRTALLARTGQSAFSLDGW